MELRNLFSADREEIASRCYRTIPKHTDCPINLKIPPDMLEDLQYKADAMDLELNHLILQILARRLDQSQGQIEEQRAWQTREDLGIPHEVTPELEHGLEHSDIDGLAIHSRA